MKKGLGKLLVVAAMPLTLPVFAFAQSTGGSQPLTRAEVTQQLIDLEKVGYDPNDLEHYPDNIHTAQHSLSAAQLERPPAHGK